MMKNRLILSTLILGVLLLSCKKEACDCQKDQPVLFQWEFINHAWGYQHNGFLIGSDATIRGFRQPAEWKFCDSLGLISEEDLEYNLAQCDTVYGEADKEQLCHFFNQVSQIATGQIVDTGLYMADAGTGVFSAWIWDAEQSRYQRVFLVSNGDLNMRNTHPQTGDLIDWLTEIGQQTDRFYWRGNL